MASNVELRITGLDNLNRVRRNLKELGETGLGREMDRKFTEAIKPLEPKVRASAEALMPSGYGPTLSASLRFRLQKRTTKTRAALTLVVHGEGQGQRRHITRINQGILRHPVYGRTRPIKNHAKYQATTYQNPWVAQRVPSGFVDKPVTANRPVVRRAMEEVLAEVDRKISGR